MTLKFVSKDPNRGEKYHGTSKLSLDNNEGRNKLTERK